MEAGRALERHVASVHRGIVFLQREHVTLLAGLHVEIGNLKRRCQELSCELDSRFPHRTTAEDEAQLTSRCEAARRLLEERRGATEAARGALRLGGARASELGRSLRRDERRFLDELKRRSRKIAALGRELQRQKGAAAALRRQLDAARAQLRRRPALEDDGGAGVRTERVRACVPRERVTSPQRPRPMPDPALFLPPPRRRAEAADREDDWEDVDEGGGLRGRVDMGGAEGETAL
ncbi:coiled-coil domain-containing protein 92-like [Hippocampus zosterae]|uniref:coiled-coil domain-containing protein 92-like n=1 Tax=Hippocampus zosterae TaxID=109293 RepID=UPI00223D4179|nr:coiled-coil domain-containing protein 92-like [Hippocampus zosterae]